MIERNRFAKFNRWKGKDLSVLPDDRHDRNLSLMLAGEAKAFNLRPVQLLICSGICQWKRPRPYLHTYLSLGQGFRTLGCVNG